MSQTSADNHTKGDRTVGLAGATGIGVGAIVGGGILALAGVAFASTGPSAIVAFALNGFIAFLTALSFAELSTAFPESGGLYAFGKKVLSVQAAFAFGWVIWFASIVAGVLYAVGFAAYALVAAESLYQSLIGTPPGWLTSSWMTSALAIGATVFFTLSLIRKATGGGQWVNISKVAVFGVLILGGVWVLAGLPGGEIRSRLQPFFEAGSIGLLQAMGYSFIALQGVDLIIAVAGEIKEPGKTIPRAVLMSLGITLFIYLPFLFVLSTVGVEPGTSIASAAAEEPEAIVAIAAQRYLGAPGYWLVILAAVLSMLTALQANLLAASRVAMAMARDRTLTYRLATISSKTGTPVNSIFTTAAIVVIILLVVRDVAAAGAAASLIFLVTYALVHGLNVLVHYRGGTERAAFRVPYFPLVPVVGAGSCIALALFQGIAEPTAGITIAAWLFCEALLYVSIFGRRAGVVDASAEALNPELTLLRGRSPLVLVPIANPANAEAMVAVASALAPPKVGRVLLLSVIAPPKEWQPDNIPKELLDAQSVLRESLTASFAAGLAPEALTTVASVPWAEIDRVSRIHRCESLLLGLGDLTQDVVGTRVENLMSAVDSDVVILRARGGWHLSGVRRVLVAVGGRGDHDQLRARLLGSLYRTGASEIEFLRVVPENASKEVHNRAQQELHRLAQDELPGYSQVRIIAANDVAGVIARQAEKSDLLILGLQRLSRRRKIFGDLALNIAQKTSCALIMISRRG